MKVALLSVECVAVDTAVRPSTAPAKPKKRRSSVGLKLLMAGTGLPLSSIDAALREAEAKGLVEREAGRVRPTERGFDFLSDLQSLFLPG